MKTLAVLFVLLACSLPSCSDTAAPVNTDTAAHVYFPLHVGDQWQYQYAVNGMRYDVCDSQVSINNANYFRIITTHTGDPFADTSFYRTEKTKVFRWKNNEERLYADYGEADTGQMTPYYQIIVARDQTFETPASTFRNCVSTINSSVHVDGDYFRNIAPMVGTVRMTGESPTFLLTYARINGKEYGKK